MCECLDQFPQLFDVTDVEGRLGFEFMFTTMADDEDWRVRFVSPLADVLFF